MFAHLQDAAVAVFMAVAGLSVIWFLVLLLLDIGVDE